MGKLNQEKANFHIFGDYNLNLIKANETPIINDFIDLMHMQGALNLINKPTRFPIGNQSGSPSLLDHWWTNQPMLVNSLDLIIDPISDHRPIFAIIKSNLSKSKLGLNNRYIRDMNNFSVEEFNESLLDFDISQINQDEGDENSEKIHETFSRFQAHIRKCIDKHAPLRTRTVKEKRFAAKPWISGSIQKSIANKNNLYSFLQNHPNPALKKKLNKMKKKTEKPSLRLKFDIMTIVLRCVKTTLEKHGN